MAQQQVKIGKGMSLPKKAIKALKGKPGMSNVGKYKTVSKGDFAGPDGTYPINSKARGESALKLAHNAKNPAAVKAKVYKKYPALKKPGKK